MDRYHIDRYGFDVSISLCSIFVPGSELTEAIAKRRKTLCNERRMPVQDVSSVRKRTDLVYGQGIRRGSRSLYYHYSGKKLSSLHWLISNSMSLMLD